ncbi:hypothetical protein LguiB_026351 [Lonicera macranthoides]
MWMLSWKKEMHNNINGIPHRIVTNRIETVLLAVTKTEPNIKFSAFFTIKKVYCLE